MSGEGLERKRSRDGEDEIVEISEPTGGQQREPIYVLVILMSVYGETDDYPTFYALASALTDEQKTRLHRSDPQTRKRDNIPGCDVNHDFGQDNDGDWAPDSVWAKLKEDKDIPEFTATHKCQVYLAYWNQ